MNTFTRLSDCFDGPKGDGGGPVNPIARPWTLRLGSVQAFMVEYARKRVIEEIDPVLLEVNFYPVMCCCP